jgi:hypothetical protein
VSVLVVDDHLLADIIGQTIPPPLARLLRRNSVATTNLYYVRLCRAALSARGGSITSGWSDEHRQQAISALAELSDDITVLPMQDLAFHMAELANTFPLSTLGAEAVAAAAALHGRLCVWGGDLGPGIEAACHSLRIAYLPIERP